MSATYNAVDVRSSAQPSRNDNWWVTMLFAVAAASPVAPRPLSPGATTEPSTAGAKNSRQTTPVSPALVLGEASPSRPIRPLAELGRRRSIGDHEAGTGSH